MLRIGRMIRIAPYGGIAPTARVHFFLLFRRRGPVWRTEACPRGSSQKIPALVLRVLTQRGAIPNDQFHPEHPYNPPS